MPMLSLLGANHCLPLFHMPKRSIWLNETKQRMNEFTIGYMINIGLNVNKSFREKVERYMYNTFGETTQPFIKYTLEKNNTSVLELIMFYETRADNPEKYFRVLSCVIYIIIKNYVCIDYIYCKSKKLNEIIVVSRGGSKNGDKSFDRILGIGIPYLLMKLMSCHGFLKNISSFVILKFPKIMLEYHFSKGCTILE